MSSRMSPLMFPIVQVIVNSPLTGRRGQRGQRRERGRPGRARASSIREASGAAGTRGTMLLVSSSAVGQSCGNCYGEGQVPTDDGPAACPDCGGAGVLPSNNVLVEWRAGEIERLHGGRGGEQI